MLTLLNIGAVLKTDLNKDIYTAGGLLVSIAGVPAASLTIATMILSRSSQLLNHLTGFKSGAVGKPYS